MRRGHLRQKGGAGVVRLEFIHTIRSMDPGIGGMKLWHMYKDAFPGIDRVGRDKFEDIIDRHGLKVRRKMRRPRTTDSTHGLPLFPNLVRELIPTASTPIRDKFNRINSHQG